MAVVFDAQAALVFDNPNTFNTPTTTGGIELDEIQGPGFLVFFQVDTGPVYQGYGITPYFYEQQWNADKRRQRELKQEAARRRRKARKALKDTDWVTRVEQARASLAAKQLLAGTVTEQAPLPEVTPTPKSRPSPATRINAFHDKMARQENIKAQRIARIRRDDDDTLAILMASIRVLFNG